MASKKPYILGIDPGLSGALAVIDVRSDMEKSTLVNVWDMPTNIKSGKKREIDVHRLAISLSVVMDEVELAVIEDVHAMPGQGVVSMFTFGEAKGIVIGMVAASLCIIYKTSPQAWKNVFGLDRDKNKSRELASKKFPANSNLWARAKDDGRAEAVLLAEFGRRFY